MVYDPKPKAKQHFMIIPTTLLQAYNLLNETHFELLEKMRDRAVKLVEECEVFPLLLLRVGSLSSFFLPFPST